MNIKQIENETVLYNIIDYFIPYLEIICDKIFRKIFSELTDMAVGVGHF